VAELVDAVDLGFIEMYHAGSSPAICNFSIE